MNTDYLCLICGAPLPATALEGETMGPLFCDSHKSDELRNSGVIGAVYDEAWGVQAPVTSISAVVQGRRISAARLLREPRTLVLTLDDDAAMIFFTQGHRTVYTQYIPGPIPPRALQSLHELDSMDADLGAVFTAIRERMCISGVDYGITRLMTAEPNIVSLHFENGRILDADCVGHSFFDIGSSGVVCLIWRDHWLPEWQGESS